MLSDYKSRTVTVDPHPLTGTPTVSIHPCQHAQVMKKVIDDWIEQGLTPRHDLVTCFLKLRAAFAYVCMLGVLLSIQDPLRALNAHVLILTVIVTN